MLASLPQQGEAARALKLALQGLTLLAGALEDQSSDFDRELRALREMRDAGDNPMVETDLSGTVWRANRAAGELSRATPHAIMRSPLATFIPEAERDAYFEALRHLRSSARDAPLR